MALKQHLLTIAELLIQAPDKVAKEFAQHWAVKYRGTVFL